VKIRRLGAIIGALALVISVAGVASADTGAPASINLTPTALDVSASGTVTWDGCTAGNTDKWIGWTVDWGDGNSDAVVATGSAPCTDDVATQVWGADTHTYASAGTMHVCVTIYDVRADADPTGKHSIDPATNDDKSTGDPPVCADVVVAPATSTDAAPASNDNGTLPLILLIVGLVAAVAVIRPLSRRSR
jgi:hypothetical protein